MESRNFQGVFRFLLRHLSYSVNGFLFTVVLGRFYLRRARPLCTLFIVVSILLDVCLVSDVVGVYAEWVL